MESGFRHLALDALFPRFCLSCGREGSLWCPACDPLWKPPQPTAGCPFCCDGQTERVCAACRGSVYLDGLQALAAYGHPVVRQAICAWKYDGDQSAELLLHAWLTRCAVFMSPPLLPFCAVGLSLHERRRRERGFDQSQAIARRASALYGIPYEDVLVRARFTSPQARQGKTQRRVGELDHAFQIRAGASVPEHVLLCDDVFTSGTTMDAAARVLKENGANVVWGWVLARGN